MPAAAEVIGAPSSPQLPAAAFAPEPDLATYLTAEHPPAAGERWVGFRSEAVLGQPDREVIDFAADVRLRQLDGRPFAGPLRVTMLVGDRLVDGSLAADRALDYSEQRPTGQVAVGPTIAFTTACAQDDEAVDVAVRDVALRPDGDAEAVVGSTVEIPFTAQVDGSGPAASAALTASTDLPDATAEPGATRLPVEGDATTTQPVRVAIPADAAPGRYTATLDATVGGETRRATATFAVTERPTAAVPAPASPAPTAAPTAVPGKPSRRPILLPAPKRAATQKRPSPTAVLSRGVVAAVGCVEACDAEVELLVYRNRRYRRATTPAGSPACRRVPHGDDRSAPRGPRRRRAAAPARRGRRRRRATPAPRRPLHARGADHRDDGERRTPGPRRQAALQRRVRQDARRSLRHRALLARQAHAGRSGYTSSIVASAS